MHFDSNISHFFIFLILSTYIIQNNFIKLNFIYPNKKNNLLKKSKLLIIQNTNFINYFNWIILTLIFYYIISNFLITNLLYKIIGNHSNIYQNLIYKFCSCWSNHEGSLFLWFFIISFYRLIFSFFKSFQLNFFYKSFQFYNNIVEKLILLCFIKNSSLFIRNEFLNNSQFELNPILQDLLLLIHPPVLYCGFLGSAILYLFGLTIIYNQKLSSEFIKKFLWINYFIWFFLTLGITLGSWWAYNELGWGGWWFWDPVENISLIPWLFSTSLLHFTKKDFNKNKYLFIMLLFVIFLLNIFGTIIIRSGFLNSVHMFINDNSREVFLWTLFFYFLIPIFSFFIIKKFRTKVFIINIKNLKRKKKFIQNLIKNALLLINLIIIFCTYAPIFITEINGIKASFYNNLFFPILFFLIICYTFRKITKQNWLFICFIISSVSVLFLFFNYPNIILISFFTIINFNLYYILFDKTKNVYILILHLFFFNLILLMLASKYYSFDFTKKFSFKNSLLLDNYEIILINALYADFLECKKSLYFFVIKSNLFQNFSITIQTEKRFFLTTELYTLKNNIFTNLIGDFQFFSHSGNIFDGWFFKINFIPFVFFIWIFVIFWLIIFLLYIYTNFIKKNEKKKYKLKKIEFF